MLSALNLRILTPMAIAWFVTCIPPRTGFGEDVIAVSFPGLTEAVVYATGSRVSGAVPGRDHGYGH